MGAIYTYWGNECHDTGKYTLAETALAEGIRLGETHWGESHPFMADLLLKQGELLYYQGAEADAKQVFERVLTICESSTYKNSRIHDCAERWLQKIVAH